MREEKGSGWRRRTATLVGLACLLLSGCAKTESRATTVTLANGSTVECEEGYDFGPGSWKFACYRKNAPMIVLDRDFIAGYRVGGAR